MRNIDIIEDSRLETEVLPRHIRHVFVRRERAGRRRKVRVTENWVREDELGRGAFGTVWLESCQKPARRGVPRLRAVKEIHLDRFPNVDYSRELEAIAKFSHDRVSTKCRSNCAATVCLIPSVRPLLCAFFRLVPDWAIHLHHHGVPPSRRPSEAYHFLLPRSRSSNNHQTGGRWADVYAREQIRAPRSQARGSCAATPALITR